MKWVRVTYGQPLHIQVPSLCTAALQHGLTGSSGVYKQVEAQHQMWKVSQIWQTFQIWWYRMLTPAPEMTQFSIQSIEEIVQSRCCQMFSSTL